MKKLIYILVMAVFCGCSLDVEPENAVTYTNMFKDEQDFQSVNYQMHSFMKSFMGWDAHMRMGFLSDEIVNETAKGLSDFNVQYMSTISNSSWKEHYDVIYMANVILDNAHRAETVSGERLDFYLGQAYYAKALVYFSLSRIWGEAIITKNSTNLDAYAKSSKIDVINEAIASGIKAYEALPKYENMRDAYGAVITTKQFGCKGAAAAVLAHAYAWKGSLIDLYQIPGEDSREAYKQAAYWCGQIIDKKAGVTYVLEDMTDLCSKGLKGMGESSESIIEFETDDFDEYFTNYTPMRYVEGYPLKSISPESHYWSVNSVVYSSTIKNMYETTDGRRAEFFFQLDAAAMPYAFPHKLRDMYTYTDWNGDEAFRAFKSNWVFIRLADIYLLRAECNQKIGENGLAAADLNVVRDRANATLYPAAGETDLKMAIFREREKELIFEGHRYYDIVRNGLHFTELGPGAAALSASDVQAGALFMPVSVNAFKDNDLMRQNSYWNRFM